MYTSSLVSSWLLLSLYFRLIFLYCLGFLFQLVRAMLLWHSPNETAINSRQKELFLRFVWCIHNLQSYTPTPLVAGKFPKGLVALLYLHRAIPCFILFYFFKVVDAINWYWLLSFWTFFFDAGATTTDQTRSPLRTSPTRWWWTPQTIITFWRQCQEIRQAVSSWPYCPVRVLITTWCTANTIQTFTITAVPVTRAAVIQLDTIIQVGVHFQVRLCRPFFGVYSIWLF